MFCNQCEQTAGGHACTKAGVCGKKEDLAGLQDLLIHALEGLALFAREGRRLGIVDTFFCQLSGFWRWNIGYICSAIAPP